MKKRVIAAVVAGFALIGAPSAVAVGGPNESGNSGHFHPNSGPCASDNDHPNCPGPSH